MAIVTYYGPRPELVVSMPMPIADIVLDEATGEIRTVRYAAGKGPIFARHTVVRFEPETPQRCAALFALGLALVRRRPSPWFHVRLGRGEWPEIAHRIPYEESCDTLDSIYFDADTIRRVYTPWRAQVLRYLGWSPLRIADIHLGEQKPLIVNGEVVWAPPGWTSKTPPPYWRPEL